jgi:hypothetical protein
MLTFISAIRAIGALVVMLSLGLVPDDSAPLAYWLVQPAFMFGGVLLLWLATLMEEALS